MIKVIRSEMNPPRDNITSNLHVKLSPCWILSSFSSGFFVFRADWFLLSFGFLFFFFFPSGLSTSIWALFSWTLSRLVSRNTTKRSNTENLKGTMSGNLIHDIWFKSRNLCTLQTNFSNQCKPERNTSTFLEYAHRLQEQLQLLLQHRVKIILHSKQKR